MIETVITAIVAYSLLEPYRLKIKEIDCQSEKIPAGFSDKTILFVSDIHCGAHFSLRRVRVLVEKMNILRPDIVIFGGDYINKRGKMAPALFRELKKVKARIAKFGIMGNHDYHFAREEALKGMRDAGIKLLDDRGYWVKIGSDRIRIGGIKDSSSGEEGDISKALKGVDDGDFRMLVAHNPVFAEKIVPGTVDVLLSGHTHGGQIAPLSLFGNVISHGFGARYCRRVLSLNGADVLISSGIGMVYFPVRLMVKPEIVLITLKSSGENKKAAH